MRPQARLALLLTFVLSGQAGANTIAMESTFSKDAMTQTLSYDGHQSLKTRDIRKGLTTWNLAASLAKTNTGESSNTIGFGGGLGWRNWNWDLTAGVSYSTNSTTNTTTIGPSGTIAYRLEFQPALRRRPKPKLLKPPPPGIAPVQSQPPGQPSGQPAQPKAIPTEAEFDIPEDNSFKPSLTMRGGVRYQKLSVKTIIPANSGPIPLPVPSESSNDLSQLGFTAIMVLSPSPSFAFGGGFTHFSYTQSSTNGNILDQLGQATQDYLNSVGALSSLGSLSTLGSSSSIGTIGASGPGGSGIQASDIPVFGSAFTFGALPRDSLDAIFLVFPASWLDIEARGTMTFLSESSETSKSIRSTFYFHLSQAWTLGAGAEYAFTSANKETFVSASLSYVFF